MLKLSQTFVIFSACISIHAHTDSQLNGTGIDWYGEIPQGIQVNCSTHDEKAELNYAAQQDCFVNHKKKAQDEAYRDFNFSKLDNAGRPLKEEAKQWHCVKDNRTGLIWEVKQTEDSFSRSSDRFTWYNSDKNKNGGNIGNWNKKGKQCLGYDESNPRTYCHTEQLVSRVNKKGLCGLNNWRLPSLLEISNLANFGRTQPAIDTNYFPNTQKGFYWTESPVADRNTVSWALSFEYGFSTPMPRTEAQFVRLVHDQNQ